MGRRASEYTRHGPPRQGDDYQDLHGAKILVEWLEHPSLYDWVRFEADDAGSLDDIVCRRSDGTFVALQVKFTVDPSEYELTWGYLLNAPQGEGGTSRSLLQKWSASLSELRTQGTIHEAALYTNRQADPAIADIMGADGRISFDDISDEQVRRQIVKQLGSEAAAREFFATFQFRLGQREPATLEAEVKYSFTQRLHGTETGWLNLLHEIRQWAKFREQPPPDGKIRILEVRRAAHWHSLDALAQGFQVPDDYVVPREFHARVLDALRKSRDACLVVTGTPGCGKSTYLSFLTDALDKTNLSVIRHHYFLSLQDSSGDRFTYRRVAESLMHQLQTRFPAAVGDPVARNPRADDLRSWLAACGEYYAAEGKPFIVIIDGLDHLWRERKPIDEATRLFEELLPVPRGVTLVVGTQPVSTERLPKPLLGGCFIFWLHANSLGRSLHNTLVRQRRTLDVHRRGRPPRITDFWGEGEYEDRHTSILDLRLRYRIGLSTSDCVRALVS